MAQSSSRGRVGRLGEDAAAGYYRARSYRVVARNWTCPLGELDLVVRRGSTLVFCEVKSRTGSAFGGPFDAVTARKQRKLRALAEAFLAQHDAGVDSVRFDVASVTIDANGAPSVFVFEGAF